jgi:hypothetical protein
MDSSIVDSLELNHRRLNSRSFEREREINFQNQVPRLLEHNFAHDLEDDDSEEEEKSNRLRLNRRRIFNPL